MKTDLLTDQAANKDWQREMCVLWTARAIAHRACNGNPDSPFVVMRDVFNEMIGRTDFGSREFFMYAPAFGINPYVVEGIDNDALTADNEHYRATHPDYRPAKFGSRE